jgi:phosphate transport system substrate-binding protein
MWGAIPLQAQQNQAQQKMVLVGSGSSLAGSLVGVWGKGFNRQRPAIQVGYVSTSSSDGIEQVGMLHEDFAVGELPLTNKQKNNANQRLAQIPIAVVSIVPVYNLSGRSELRFTGELLAQIYMGHISNWNDERIAKLNPGVVLPDLPITLVQRPEGTGSRYIFTEFLAKTSAEFRRWTKSTRHEAGSEVVEERSQGMADKVASTPGAMGFVDWRFAEQFGLPYGSVQNSSGKFVKASLPSISAASTAMQELAFTNSPGPLLNAPGENSYPLTSFAWAYLPVTGMAPDRTNNLYEFLNWCLGEGQSLMAGHGYDRLPEPVATKAQAKLQALLR